MKNKIARKKKKILTRKKEIAKLKKKSVLTSKESKRLVIWEKELDEMMSSLELFENRPDYVPQRQHDILDPQFKGYHQYITSPEWKKRREVYYQTHKHVCRTCGAAGNGMHLHHRTYARVYMEDDSDLMPLCPDCHYNLHVVQRGLNLTVEQATTLWFSCTNNTDDKKKIRAKLRDLDHSEFCSLWNRRIKADVPPEQILNKVVEHIVSGDLAPRDDVITDVETVKKVINKSKITGFNRSYDRMVDKLIKKLEKPRGSDKFRI